MQKQQYDAWRADWWSRLMAFGSLAVAAAALWYAYEAQPSRPVAGGSSSGAAGLRQSETGVRGPDGRDWAAMQSRLEEVQRSLADLKRQSQQVSDGWTAMDARLLALQQRMDGSEATAGAGQPERKDDAFEDMLEPPPGADSEYEGGYGDPIVALPETDAAASHGNPAEEGLLPEADEGETAASPPATALADAAAGDAAAGDAAGDDRAAADLRVVRSSLRPLESEYAVTVTIRNEGDAAAVIWQVEFEPRDIVEDVSTELAVQPLRPAGAGEFVITFLPADNEGYGQDQQGTYRRPLADPLRIGPGEQVDVRMAIRHAEHLGFGLLGRLSFLSDAVPGEGGLRKTLLEVPNTAVAFINPPEVP